MKATCVLTSLILMVSSFGCSMANSDQTTWEEVNKSVEGFTELAARVAFVRDDVKPYKQEICNAVKKILPLLETYDDSDATFETMRGYILRAIKDLPEETLNEQAKEICILVMDQVLDIVFRYARDSYLDMINQNEAWMAITTCRAIARGLDNACLGVSLQFFSVEKSG